MGLGDLTNQDRPNHVKQFAARNPSVLDLQFYRPNCVDVINFHYRMERDMEGNITGMIEVRKNGMCYGNGFASVGADFIL